MKTHFQISRNEEGNVVILVLLIMTVVTMMGVASLNTTELDLLISQNNRQFERDYYNAEAALTLAVENISDLPAAPSNALPLTTDINRVFNPQISDQRAWYSWWSPLTHPDGTTPVALVEVRRISPSGAATVSIAEGNADDGIVHRELTAHANSFPSGTYRSSQNKDYDIVKLVVTATAVDPNTASLTNVAVQGGTGVYVAPLQQR